MRIVILLFALVATPLGGQVTPDSAAQTADSASAASDTAAGEPEAVPADRARQDADLRSDLQTLYDRIEPFERIDVSVEAGVVTLRGTVLDADAADEAAELARQTTGVRFVIERLERSRSVEERLTPTWSRVRELAAETIAQLPLLLVAVSIVAVAALLGWLVRRWRGPTALVSRNPFLQGLLQRALQALLVFGGILLALDLLGATALLGAVAGTAGLAGLALGFAFKDIGENYLSGVLLSLRPPFGKNDHILLESFEGKVVRLSWRDTILMTLDGNHVRIPNARVFASPLINFTRNPRRRFEFDFGIGPAADLGAAQEIGLEALRGMKAVLTDPPPQALVVDVGDSTVGVRWLAWIDQRASDLLRARSEGIRLVKLRLEAAGIELPSPEYLVRLQREGQGGGGAAPAVTQVVERDTSADRSVEVQIEEERRDRPESNLLDDVVRERSS
ncbi:MAG: mechanosensitive ion channel family protein [Gemmatimonadota bacterium]